MANASGKNCRLHIYLLAMLAIMTTASLAGLLYFSQLGPGSNRALLASGENPDPAHITVNGDTITVSPVGDTEVQRTEFHPWADRITDDLVGDPDTNPVCTPDVRNIQWAVDNVTEGGTVILASGTYQFGDGWFQKPNPMALDFAPFYLPDSGWAAHADFVGFDRNLTIRGEGMPKIVGGFSTFRTYDEVDLTIEGIHFDQAVGIAIAVPAANDVVIRNNKITNVQSEFNIPIGATSNGIYASESHWAFSTSIAAYLHHQGYGDMFPEMGGISESTGTFLWLTLLNEPWFLEYILEIPPEMHGMFVENPMNALIVTGNHPALFPSIPYFHRTVPQLPGQPVSAELSEYTGFIQNFQLLPYMLFSNWAVPWTDDLNTLKHSPDRYIRNLTIENNEIDMFGDNPANDPVFAFDDPSTYADIILFNSPITYMESTGDSEATNEVMIRGNSIKNYQDGIWSVGTPNADITVDSNVFVQRYITNQAQWRNNNQFDWQNSKDFLSAIRYTEHWGKPAGILSMTNNDFTLPGYDENMGQRHTALMASAPTDLTVDNNVIKGGAWTGLLIHEWRNSGDPDTPNNVTVSNNDLTGLTTGRENVMLSGFLSGTTVTGNKIGKVLNVPVSFTDAPAAGIKTEGSKNIIKGNDFSASGIMGIRDGGVVPSVMIGKDIVNCYEEAADGDCLKVGVPSDNFIKEQGNYVPGTGGATFQVIDLANPYCTETNPSDPFCADFIPNRVVGHPADVFEQQEEAHPGIGEYMGSQYAGTKEQGWMKFDISKWPNQSEIRNKLQDFDVEQYLP